MPTFRLVRAGIAVALLAAWMPVPSARAASSRDEALELIAAGEPEQALEVVRKALAVDPHSVESRALEVGILGALGRLDEAVPPLEAWANERPLEAEPLALLAMVHAEQGRWDLLSGLCARADGLPDAVRDKLMSSIVMTQLEYARWEEASHTLSLMRPGGAVGPLEPMFAALESARSGREGATYAALADFLRVPWPDPVKDRALWWAAMLYAHAAPGGPASREPATAAPEDRPIVPVGDVVLPTLIRKIEPEYPEEARQARKEGKVILQATVLTTGHVALPVVLSASDPVFVEPARRAISGWRYVPASQSGKPVAVYYTIRIDFKLRSSGDTEGKKDAPEPAWLKPE